ncbi:YciI family protein [Cellulosimicrobium sp. PMB13]|uniref:YciI family protein n=1 Tax=Cellulosimicrobium sp. PMB13 TaxID=3120158 RepID=UPI003F4C5B7C
MSTEYVILIHDDESAWVDPSPELRAATYARHDEFARLAAAEGHRITGGGELHKTFTARVVRPGATPDQALVTDGPFAELAEQVGGYYVVESSDLDGLVRALATAFAGSPESFEIRPVVSEAEHAAGQDASADVAGVGA